MQDPRPRLLAAALDGNIEALRQAAELDPNIVIKHRIAPALALQARRTLLEHPNVEHWQAELRQTVALQLFLEAAAEQISQALSSADIPWLPLKGFDLASRVYDEPAARPFGDLDLLIRPDDLASARLALCAAGWRDLDVHPQIDRYLDEEGYAWQAIYDQRLLVEVHFRLWGSMPEEYVTELFERSQPAPDLGSTARRSSLADAFVIAAVHLVSESPPRAVGRFWDLARIAATAGEEGLAVVSEITVRHGLVLPVAMASYRAGQLWSEPRCQELASTLTGHCRWPERPVLSRARERDLPFATIVLARLLAGRSSRAGWRSVWRRLWPHPALVTSATPSSWSWPRRRLVHLWKNLRGR